MKKTLLYSAILLAASGFAQSNLQTAIKVDQNIDKAVKIKYKGQSTGAEVFPEITSIPNNNYRVAQAEENVGETMYDLQTNHSVQDRIINHGDGTISTVWTFSLDGNAAAANRGTGYNYFDGANWVNTNFGPTTRIESKRTGWPTLLQTASGREIVISHNTDDDQLLMSYTDTKGNQIWTAKPLYDSLKLYWNRAVVGGTDNNTIHMVALTLPTATGGLAYDGMDGALLYLRSTDAGDTWDSEVLINHIDTTDFSYGIGGDTYSISAKGDTVGIVVGDSWSDVVLLKSTDNGDNWGKRVIYNFPYDKFDETTDLVLDTPYASDGFTSIYIDSTGLAHVWYGNMRVLNDDLGDEQTSFFPGTNGLVYWNENKFQGEVIASALDHDSDLSISTAVSPNYDFPGYNSGLSSMPSVGMGQDGTMYVTYSAHHELYHNGIQNYRHVFGIKSTDGGNSWSEPRDLTPNDDFGEYVYASLARNVDDHLHILLQYDTEPGLAVLGDEDAFDINKIKYVKVGIEWTVGVEENIPSTLSKIEVYPNPATDQVSVNFISKKNTQSQIEIFDALGNMVFQSTNELKLGNNRVDISVSQFSTGVYFIKSSVEGESIVSSMIIN